METATEAGPMTAPEAAAPEAAAPEAAASEVVVTASEAAPVAEAAVAPDFTPTAASAAAAALSTSHGATHAAGSLLAALAARDESTWRVGEMKAALLEAAVDLEGITEKEELLALARHHVANPRPPAAATPAPAPARPAPTPTPVPTLAADEPPSNGSYADGALVGEDVRFRSILSWPELEDHVGVAILFDYDLREYTVLVGRHQRVLAPPASLIRA